MKNIKLVILMVFVVGVLSIGRPGAHGYGCQSFLSMAHAQAVNHDVMLSALHAMKKNINRMIQLVERHKAGNINIGNESVDLSTAQSAQLITAYNTLKTNLAANYAALP